MTIRNEDYNEFGAQYGDFPNVQKNGNEDSKIEISKGFISRQGFKDEDYNELGAQYGTPSFSNDEQEM